MVSVVIVVLAAVAVVASVVAVAVVASAVAVVCFTLNFNSSHSNALFLSGLFSPTDFLICPQVYSHSTSYSTHNSSFQPFSFSFPSNQTFLSDQRISGRGPPGGGRGGAGGRGGRGGRGGAGGARGGPPGRGGAKAGAKVVIERHRLPGIFVAKGKSDTLLTRNLDPGVSVYGEKRISVETEADGKIEYRVWNPFSSKLAAAVAGGIEDIWIRPGSKVLYLGAASGTSVSHVSDLIGPEGTVYAVEFALRPGRDFVNMAKRRTNIVPIVEDARYPLKYRMLLDMVDVVFADVAQPDQARIVGLNAQYFLKAGGHCVISIKASCIDSTSEPAAVYAQEMKHLQTYGFRCRQYATLEPYERDHCVVVARYRNAEHKAATGEDEKK